MHIYAWIDYIKCESGKMLNCWPGIAGKPNPEVMGEGLGLMSPGKDEKQGVRSQGELIGHGTD